MPSGKTKKVWVDLDDEIVTIKADLRIEDGIPRSIQRLIFADNDLEDRRTLSSHNIQKESTLHLALQIRGGGKRARAGAGGEFDKTAYLETLRTDYRMKATAILVSEVPRVSALARQILERVDHLAWFSQCMAGMTKDELKSLRDAVLKTSNSDQKIRLLVKCVFKDALTATSRATTEITLVTNMRAGLLDLYLSFVAGTCYLSDVGEFKWETFSKEIDDVVSGLIREEGRAAAQAGVPMQARVPTCWQHGQFDP